MAAMTTRLASDPSFDPLTGFEIATEGASADGSKSV
jgi:hypothetical protein